MKQAPKLKVVSNYVYNLNDVLGIGTWGTVYKATSVDQTDKKLYALKKMNKFKVQSYEGSVEKYQNQVIALQRAKNIPQVIQFVDFFKTKSHYYIVTQYYEGSEDLYSYMNRMKKKFTEHQARPIFQNVLKGILQLHKLNISHRDIKLQNILYLPSKNQAKVIDFGLAVCLSSLQNPNSKVGSPLFMSPQIVTQTPYSHKCDIWSLGILFYYMICRTSPYGENPSVKQILEGMQSIRINGVQYPQDEYVSDGCKELIEGCLKWNENDRMQIKELLLLRFFDKQNLKHQLFLKDPNYKCQLWFKN